MVDPSVLRGWDHETEIWARVRPSPSTYELVPQGVAVCGGSSGTAASPPAPAPAPVPAEVLIFLAIVCGSAAAVERGNAPTSRVGAFRAKLESTIAAIDEALVAEELIRLREAPRAQPPELRVVEGGRAR